VKNVKKRIFLQLFDAKMKFMKLRWKIYHVLIAGIFLFLSGCQQQRADLADVISPPNDAQMAVRVAESSAAVGVPYAIAMGEKFLAAHPGVNPNVRAKLVQLYLDQGDAAKALAHLSELNRSEGGVEVTVPQSSAKAEDPLAPSMPSAKVGPDGLEASVGNVQATVK